MNPFQVVAEHVRMQGRLYRLRAWRCLWIPALYCALAMGLAIIVGFTTEQDWLVAALGCSGFLLVVLGGVAAFAYFLHALVIEGHAQRNERAAKDVPVSGEKLLQIADSSSRIAQCYERWGQRALMAGYLLFGLSLLGFLLLVVLSRFDWEAVGRTLTMNGEFLELPVVVLVGVFFPALLLRWNAEKRRRQAELLRLCHDLGFSYHHLPAEAHLLEFAALPLFHHGWQRNGLATHLMAGTIARRPLRLMLYAYAHQSGTKGGWNPGKWNTTPCRLLQTVVLMRASMACPEFRLWPLEASYLDNLGLKRSKHVDARSGLRQGLEELPLASIADSAELAQDYRLFGRSENCEILAALLHERVFALLGDHPRLVLETANGLLALYEPGHVWNGDEYTRRIGVALAVADALDNA